MTTTSTADYVLHSKNGDMVYPCWCGAAHRGAYAQEEWMRHNCLHSKPLFVTAGPGEQVMCVECGQTFSLDREV